MVCLQSWLLLINFMDKMNSYNGNIKNISCSAWNVNGLSKKKLQDKEFLKNVKKYDIICLSETWTKKSSEVMINGFKHFHAQSVNMCKKGRRSGGVIVYVKNKLIDGVTCIKTDTNNIWLQLSATFFGWVEDIYLLNTYIPPQNSIYFDNQMEMIETDIITYSNQGKIIIMGDLNARVGNEPDYITNDELDDFIPLPDSYCVDEITKIRAHCDAFVNECGKRLLELCISSNLRIMNGRFIGDSMGRFTYYSTLGASTIDYGICDKSILNLIKHFSVFPLTEYSDHCQIAFSILCFTNNTHKSKNSTKIHYNKTPIKSSPLWREWSKETYTEAIWNDNCINRLVSFMNNKYDINTKDANKAVEDLTNIIQETAASAVEIRKIKTKPKQIDNKLGYDTECLMMKRKLRGLAKKLHKNPLDLSIKANFLKIKSQYKKLVKTKDRNFRTQILDDLQAMQHTSNKQYWKLLGKLQCGKRAKRENLQPPSDDLIQHYEQLNLLTEPSDNKQKLIIEETKSLEKTVTPVKMLDKSFTVNEVKEGINRLKLNKACGPDQVLNEFLIYGKDALCAPLSKIFNICLKSQCYPENWSEGHITSIFKSGDHMDPNNYRGLTILSCIGKLFTSLLNERLFKYLMSNELLNKWQAGFIPGYRTTDQTFILKSLIQKYIQSEKKKLFVCFVDFKKAFDLVWHDGLFNKLLNLGIGGNFYHTLKNMYQSNKVRVKTIEGLSHCIKTGKGVRQGDCLSPLLFNLFINDLPNVFLNTNSKPPILDKMTIPALLYADDLIIISESAEGLQHSLHLLHEYCNKWELRVNLKKTNAMQIGKGKSLSKQYKFGNEEINTVSTYKYLGSIVNDNGTFSNCKKDLKQKGMKALFSIWKSIGTGKIPPIKIANKLFDVMVKPITLYNCEVWGAEIPSTFQAKITQNITIPFEKYMKHINDFPHEQLHLKFCKMLLGVKKSTSNIASRAELGRMPLIIEMHIRMIKYWIRLVKLPKDRIVVDALNANNKLLNSGRFSWTSMIKQILETSGFPDVWTTQNVNNEKQFLKCLEEKLKQKYLELFSDTLNSDIRKNPSQGNKLRTYRILKDNHNEESYLTVIANPNIRSAVAKFRLSCHKLMIERGRYFKLCIDDRTCSCCNITEDELHAIMFCSKYARERTELFNNFQKQFSIWDTLNTTEKFKIIMSMKCLTFETGKYIHQIVSTCDSG